MARRKEPGCFGSLVQCFLWLMLVSAVLAVLGAIADWLHITVWGALALIFLAPVLLYLFVRLVAFLLLRLAQKLDESADPENAGTLAEPPEYDIPPQEPPLVIKTQKDLDRFCRTHRRMETICTKVVGVTYPNHEHVSRQALLPCCHSGDPVSIVPYRYQGEPAYFVVADCGEIGNLNKSLAAKLYTKYGDEAIFMAAIDEITGGYNGLSYGCSIIIHVYMDT